MAVSDYAFHSLEEKYWISVSWPAVEGDRVSSFKKLGWIQIHRAPFLSISKTCLARYYFLPWVPNVFLNVIAKPSFMFSLPSKYKFTGGLFQTKRIKLYVYNNNILILLLEPPTSILWKAITAGCSSVHTSTSTPSLPKSKQAPWSVSKSSPVPGCSSITEEGIIIPRNDPQPCKVMAAEWW